MSVVATDWPMEMTPDDIVTPVPAVNPPHAANPSTLLPLVVRHWPAVPSADGRINKLSAVEFGPVRPM